MQETLSQFSIPGLSQYLNTGYLKYIGVICIFLALLSFVGKRVSSGRAVLTTAIATTVGILFMYVIVIAARNINLIQNIPTLPFADVVNNRLYILPIIETDLNIVCLEFLKLLILATFVAILDTVLPDPKKVFVWLIRNIFLLLLSFLCQVAITYVLVNYAPSALLDYAPIILFAFMVFVMFLGLFKSILGIALTAMNPILGGIYGFFFMHRIGKKLTSATISTILIGALIFATDYFGYSVITLENSNFLFCLPFLVILSALWYIT